MNSSAPSEPSLSLSSLPQGVAEEGAKEWLSKDTELARYLPHLSRISAQLKQTSTQIESSVVGVCNNFQGIAERARSTVSRTTDFLSNKSSGTSSRQSFEDLIQNCSDTLIKILNTTEEAGEVSRRAIDRINQMDKASQLIGTALVKLEQIAHENKMLAMNARIEAAHAGVHGAGFAVVAVEVVSQTERAQEVTAQVGGLIADLRALAGSTLEDLQQTNEQDAKRVEKCRREVDESLRDMQDAHGEMEQMLTGMTEEGALLATDIGSAVRGLQFQDRTSQQIAHVVEDLDTLHTKLTARFGAMAAGDTVLDEGFSAYTMYEERQVAGIGIAESAGGDIELF
jgi:methyl-accepting chemotaxis protein